VPRPLPLLLLCLTVRLAACAAADRAEEAPLAPSSLSAPAARDDAPFVRTDRGIVTGKVGWGDVRAYLGIPYAAPPTGALRWRPPADVAPWTGARDATRFGSACTQLDGDELRRKSAEDCLTINVWAPRGGAPDKPVLVFIPGGAFVEGSAGFPLYDGARLAERTGSVVATIDYRVGALGFLALPALAREVGRDAAPSFGLLDQQAALRWVQRNVRAFGGDPSRVTIFGESAGAWSVCAHMTMPGSRGLFARAIMESGACADPLYFGAREAEAQGAALATALGCGADDLACLRGKSAEAVVRALPSKRGMVVPPGVWWGPVIDGTDLPEVPLVAIRAGRAADVPLLLGWNRDEGVLHTARLDDVTAGDVASFVRDSFGDAAAFAVALRYRRPTPKDALTDVITDGAFACESRRAARALAARGAPVFLYELTHALDHPRAHPLGATHSVELWFVFGNTDGGIGLSDDEVPLSHVVMDAWGRFARSGDPSGGGLAWPRYSTERDELLVLDTKPAVQAGVKAEACDFWDHFERVPR
jgi:para-nitrobenzyl esterase